MLADLSLSTDAWINDQARVIDVIRDSLFLFAESRPAGGFYCLLTDGKPNDLDKYEGRYGIEDTRHALKQARDLGLQPFCVTVDQQAGEYLPHLFGSGGYVVIHRSSQLPRELPLLYARLTA